MQNTVHSARSLLSDDRMDSIANHYAARRLPRKSSMAPGPSNLGKKRKSMHVESSHSVLDEDTDAKPSTKRQKTEPTKSVEPTLARVQIALPAKEPAPEGVLIQERTAVLKRIQRDRERRRSSRGVGASASKRRSSVGRTQSRLVY